MIKNRTFGEAIEHIKLGGRASREGWNGKEQYISLGFCVRYLDVSGSEFIAEHQDIGSRVIIFHDTRGSQAGWLASQSDMIAEDWCLH